MKETTKGRLLMLLFALPFASGGLGILIFSVIPSLYEWHDMNSWPQVDAHLQSAGVNDDGDTYQAIARYSYRYQAQNYTSERVAIIGGSDNIGHFQQGLARHLELAHRMGQPVPAWVNPNDPGDAVLNRDLR